MLQNLASLSPCTHKEAHSRMLLHANHTAHSGHQKVIIRTVDTDVALSVYVAQTNSEYAFGSGKHFWYLAAHSMTMGLGPKEPLLENIMLGLPL